MKGIKIGKMPQRAATVSERNEIYVANREDCSISVVSTTTNKSVKTIELGKTAKALVAGHDGHIYVLAQGPTRSPCTRVQNEDGNYSVGIISTRSGTVESWKDLSGQRWDDLALSTDGRLFLTRVLPFGSAGVYVFDTGKQELEQSPVVAGSGAGCPVDLALAERQNELFVSYQCGGPGGSYGHDSIVVYCVTAKGNCRSAYDPMAVLNGIPNVGGPISVSPDESYLWAYGDDACSSRAYDHKGCPGNDPSKHSDEPTRIVNVIDTDSLVTRTYGFPLGDDGKYVSFSPELEAYIGGQSGIKVISKPGVGLPNKIPAPSDATCSDLNSAGDIKFSRVGSREYMYAVAGEANAVCVFERPAVPDTAISPSPVLPTLAGKMYAIVIGIKSYRYPRTPLLRPLSDAANVATELREHYGFDIITLPENLKCEGAGCTVTKQQVIAAFENLLKNRIFNPQDQLLVYIAAHGDRWSDGDGSSHPYLVTSDSTLSYLPDQSAKETEVDYREIWNLFGKSSIRHVLFVVDACLAGSYDPTFQVPFLQQGGRPFLRVRSLPEVLSRNIGLTRKYLSASPFSTEEVPDASPFAEAFVQALDKLRSSSAGYFTFENVLMKMANLVPQPRPSSFSSSDAPHGDFIFVPQAVEAAQQSRKTRP